jgi:hypothetical protein
MRRTTAAFALLAVASLPAAAGDDPVPPAPAPEAPKAAPIPVSEGVRELLAKAAARQGTADLVGEKAPTRFLARFLDVVVHGAKGRYQIQGSREAFALPEPGKSRSRLRSEASVDGTSHLLGHDGHLGWMWTEADGTRWFNDRDRDVKDIEDLDHRLRMHRLALRVFFLGNLADGGAAVRLLPDEEKVLPVGHEGRTRTVACRVLERAADPQAGEPAVRVWLEKETLDPAAVALLPAAEGEPTFLLTVAFDSEAVREKAGARKTFPKGVRVPDWVEMFEVPGDPKEKPVLRLQAGLQGLTIDPAEIPDSLFKPPPPK